MSTATKQTATLTPDERKEFNFLNFLAFDIARLEASKKDQKIPMWLCTSEESREEYRKNAIKTVNEMAGRKLQPHAVEAILSNAPGMPEKLKAWKEWETEFKRLRVEENNPQAFFC